LRTEALLQRYTEIPALTKLLIVNPTQPIKRTGGAKMTNKSWIILLTIIIVILGGLVLWGWFREMPVVHDADYAREICGEQPVVSFDSAAGKVECAQWKPDELAPEPEEPMVEPAVAPTFIPEPSATVMPLSEDKAAFVPYESEGGVPFSGDRLSIDVAPDEIEVVTAGPACIFGVCLPGGEKRGSVILMLGGNEEVVSYTITGLIAGANWHASYRPFDNPLDESIWRALANDRVEAMQIAPNCTDGKGCDVIDILVVDEDGIIDQWVVGK